MIREYVYAYCALSPQTGDCYSIISPVCNSHAMNEFLSQLASHYQQYRIILILDKAGWHISHSLQLPDNILIMHLAPYSPELNPVELLWREIRAKYFHNNIFQTMADVEDRLANALYDWHFKADAIKSLAEGFICK